MSGAYIQWAPSGGQVTRNWRGCGDLKRGAVIWRFVDLHGFQGFGWQLWSIASKLSPPQHSYSRDHSEEVLVRVCKSAPSAGVVREEPSERSQRGAASPTGTSSGLFAEEICACSVGFGCRDHRSCPKGRGCIECERQLHRCMC
ncbi:unnamed protein product [Vitrella brassicaformis CCMP3155]|uniref:Uncharacterized protein n=1 Tax=Vitrella brassicaformis (strain CCMP3155) TaxID=1169540 RepID=A0A0G4FT66_VITBC|nr:unnamed protein product [Vitrella brassicaformis CCMP3155]|eukprot:CEM17818.1 unnamed protein product [Vitrella brassicaformis CCMP3155]